jgi:hypothetical protein
MSDSIINFLKKQGDIFSSAKYFGGIDKLREIGKTNPEIMDMITKSSYGYMEFQAGDRPGRTKTYKFNFYVLDYDMEDDTGGDYNHAYLSIDLIVDYPNLTDNEILRIGKWVAEYCEDGRCDYNISNKIFEESMMMADVKKINGKDVPWEPGNLLGNQSDIVPDVEVDELIKKSKSGGTVKESVVRIKKLLKVDLK